ncbi:hypothetical protein CHGG_07550 [Chaetomium globosum CBS 148.51]|uniref:CCHC-type domain-containing protein n=1 Tax=Chaetomium globosum (strain ATCC 6205 / CBS 148.51 / DSM 1962 / NBRC 6347 / NRRL 1970) TaxID=306901 RepID=Q2GWV4_CHAGB|nr:uncharacterized protein CHGG_07550 [Chaetomium globosum CBS 148.51]EAQ86297.1 hypothetical protein CHGG_07550 [Chaetomium globosum CBS 148.51]
MFRLKDGLHISVFAAKHDTESGKRLSTQELCHVLRHGDDSQLPTPGLFFYAQGIPVVVTRNQFVGLKVVNGAPFKAVDIFPDLAAGTIALASDVILHLGPPVAVLLQSDDSAGLAIPGLPNGTILIKSKTVAIPSQMRGKEGRWRGKPGFSLSSLATLAGRTFSSSWPPGQKQVHCDHDSVWFCFRRITSQETGNGLSNRAKQEAKKKTDSLSGRSKQEENKENSHGFTPSTLIVIITDYLYSQDEGEKLPFRFISEMLSRNKNKKLTVVVPRTQGERFRYLLVCWMATANIPFAAVENKYYRQILQLFNAPLTDALLPKGGDTTRSWLTSMYHDLLDSIKVKLKASLHQKHLSFDLWTSSHDLALLAVVVHYFESSGNYQTHLLTLSRITGTHASENIAPGVLDVIKTFDLQPCLGYFQTDNADNNDTAMTRVLLHLNPTLSPAQAIALKCKVRVRCFGHILNLVAKAFLQATNKKLIKSLAPESLAHHNAAEEGRLLQEWRKSGPIGKLHFLVHHIRRSPQRRDLFSDIAKSKLTEEEQQEFGAILMDKDIAKLQLRSDNETRWHSVYHMIDRAIMLRDPLDYFVNIVTKKDPDNITSDDQLTPSEWVVLKEIRCILEPFKIITKKFEGRKPNFADVVSHAYTLHRNLNELYQQYARTASQHHGFHGGPWVGIRPPSPALGNSVNPGRMQSLSSDPDPDIEPPSQRRSGRTIRPPAHLDDFEVDLPALGYRPSTTEPHPAPSPRPQQRVVQLGEVIDDEVDDTGYAFIQKSLKLAIKKLEKYLAIMDATPAYWAAMILLPNCKMRWIERFFTDDPLKSSDIQARFRVFFDHNYPRPAPDSSNGSRDRPSHRPAFGYDFYDPLDRVSVDERCVPAKTAASVHLCCQAQLRDAHGNYQKSQGKQFSDVLANLKGVHSSAPQPTDPNRSSVHHHCQAQLRGAQDDLTKRRTSIRKIRERFIGERRSRPGSFCESRAALPRDCKMAAEAQPQIVVEVADQPPSPRRPSRALKPSAKAREAMQSLEDVATTSRRAASETTRAVTTRGARASGILYGANSRIETGKSGIQMLLEAINEQRDEMYRMITEQRNTIGELREVICKQHDAIQELHRQLADTRTQLSEELRQARDQIDTLQRHPVAMASSQPSARGSYAEVARTPPSSQPSGVRTLSSRNTTPSSFTDTLFCTIDTSRVEEKEKGNVQVADIRKAIETEARAQESMGDWRCAAVVKEARNPDRVRVICRDEGEVQLVKEAAVKISVPGVRVLRDQLYPVRVDNANRTAVLDADGNILPGAAEALGTENDVNIAKIAWLSRKDTSKAYGSMVVYVTKGSEARRLLDERYFHLAGESAYTTVFAPREGPIQCYRCQEIGHKAFACKKPQRCGRCAEQGHHHKTCQSVTLKILQLNVRKRREVQQSLLNDEGLKDFAVLAISEPYARLIEGSVTTVPMSHHNWTKLIPTTRRETTWPIRSMLWVRSDIEVEQIPVPSADLTVSTHSAPRSGSADGVSQTNYSDARFTPATMAQTTEQSRQLLTPRWRDRPSETRFLFKNAPWAEIRTRVAANLERIPWDGNVQQQTDRLMAAVTRGGLRPDT